MDDRGSLALALPRPGRALTILLVLIAGLGIFTAFLNSWIPQADVVFAWLDFRPARVADGEVWRLLTSGLLTNQAHQSHLISMLLGLYFLGTTLEKKWGWWRFVRFLALSVVAGNLVVLMMDAAIPNGDLRFHREAFGFYGASAAIAAIATAWARENPELEVRLLFILPLKGKYFLWITIGFCVLGLIYQEPLPEGNFAPFGGVLVGLIFAGTPSIARTLFLKAKLAVLRRRRSSLRVEDVLSASSRPAKRARPANAPPLRVVQGGLDEVLRNRKVPKDKRYLN